MDIDDLNNFITDRKDDLPSQHEESTPDEKYLRRPQQERHKANIEDLYEENVETRDKLHDLYRKRNNIMHQNSTPSKDPNLKHFHKLYENSKTKDDNLMGLLNARADEEAEVCTFNPGMDLHSKELCE